MTTRCVHLDLLSNMETDSFLMALRHMVARRGTPSEILADQGTNFLGGDKELQTAFTSMSSGTTHQRPTFRRYVEARNSLS